MRTLFSSDEDALTVPCPECSMPVGTMCVYMPIAGADPNSTLPTVIAKLARVGTPTQRTHNRRRKKAQHVRRTAHKPPQPPPTNPELLAAYRAAVAWDIQEFNHLREWYAAYGHILSDQ